MSFHCSDCFSGHQNSLNFQKKIPDQGLCAPRPPLSAGRALGTLRMPRSQGPLRRPRLSRNKFGCSAYLKRMSTGIAQQGVSKFLNLYRNSDSSNPFGLDRKRAKGFRTILMFKQASIAIYAENRQFQSYQKFQSDNFVGGQVRFRTSVAFVCTPENRILGLPARYRGIKLPKNVEVRWYFCLYTPNAIV